MKQEEKRTENVVERRRAVLDAMDRGGGIRVRQLADHLGCSEMTVRRDLNELERDGIVRRVHDGAVAVQLRRDESPYIVRALVAVETKQRIGRAVAALIADGETVILDSGTTALEVARALRGRYVTVRRPGQAGRAAVGAPDDRGQ